MQLQDFKFPDILQHGLNPDWPAGVAAQCIVLVNFREMLEGCSELAETMSPESVHRTRVAARRTRAALRAYQSCWAKSLVKFHLKSLSRFAQGLSLCRDLDVFMLYLEPENGTGGNLEWKAEKSVADFFRSKRHSLEQVMAGALQSFLESGFIQDFLDYYSSEPFNLCDRGSGNG